jgi:hypothetical protein
LYVARDDDLSYFLVPLVLVVARIAGYLQIHVVAKDQIAGTAFDDDVTATV